MQNKIKDYLGLAKVSRKLFSGSLTVYNLIKEKKAVLIILSSFASENTKKRFYDKARFYNVDIIELEDDIITSAFKDKNIMVIAITDIGFKNQILKFKGM